jgi:hypothetical protein
MKAEQLEGFDAVKTAERRQKQIEDVRLAVAEALRLVKKVDAWTGEQMYMKDAIRNSLKAAKAMAMAYDYDIHS